jgi:glycosyltransferase involved in cell wall biosynthesis
MHILLFAHFAGSPYHGMVFGHYYLAREWVKMGHEVTIVAASFAHTRFTQPEQSKKLREEMIDGIRYLWVPTPRYKPADWFGRIRSILSFTWKTRFLPFPVKKADLVICSSHYTTPICAAKRYADRLNAKLVFEVRDIWPLTLTELGGASAKNPFIMWLQRAENFAYKHADKVVTVLSGSKDHMLDHGMKPEKFVFIPNGVSFVNTIEKAELPPEHFKRLQEFRQNKKLVIGYAGRIGLANALHVLIEALALTKDLEIGVAILGSGSHLDELKALAQKLEIEKNVLFLDPVNKDQVPAFLEKLDAAYIGLQKQSLFRFGVSPTKLNDFMLAGKPIIYAIEAPGNIVEESGAGISCAAESPDFAQ